MVGGLQRGKDAVDEAGWRRVLPEILGGVSPGDELRAATERRREVDRGIERIEDAIGESKEALECIDRRIAGGSCGSLLDRVSKAGRALRDPLIFYIK